MWQKTAVARSGRQMIYLTTIGVDETADESLLLRNFGQSQTESDLFIPVGSFSWIKSQHSDLP